MHVDAIITFPTSKHAALEPGGKAVCDQMWSRVFPVVPEFQLQPQAEDHILSSEDTQELGSFLQG